MLRRRAGRVGHRRRAAGFRRPTNSAHCRAQAGHGRRPPADPAGHLRLPGCRRWRCASPAARRAQSDPGAAASGPGFTIVLCQQSDDLAVATGWLHTLTAAGLEGVVVKDAGKPYPTREGQRGVALGQAPLRDRHSGHRRPGRTPRRWCLPSRRTGDALPAAGWTTRLSRAVARRIAPLITLTGAVGTRRSAWGTRDAVEVQAIIPLVVEISADAAISDGVMRHSARLLRVRPDLDALSEPDLSGSTRCAVATDHHRVPRRRRAGARQDNRRQGDQPRPAVDRRLGRRDDGESLLPPFHLTHGPG